MASAKGSEANYQERRERVFLLLAGFFIASMTLLNVIGITRFIQLGPMTLAIGVLPYPLTFLCTDLISELYGRRRANFLVTVGLILNGFILLIMYIGQALPSVPSNLQLSWQVISLANELQLPNGDTATGSIELFHLLYSATSASVFASMLAYIAAQYCDVQLFHFWKRLTKGKHLWLRNNFSTLISQIVDSVVVIGVTFGAALLAEQLSLRGFLVLIGSSYAFKMVVAMLDTLPIYWLVYKLRPYLNIQDEAPSYVAP